MQTVTQPVTETVTTTITQDPVTVTTTVTQDPVTVDRDRPEPVGPSRLPQSTAGPRCAT